nr:hypothetical protein [uncultured Helicobacter sp.]
MSCKNKIETTKIGGLLYAVESLCDLASQSLMKMRNFSLKALACQDFM